MSVAVPCINMLQEVEDITKSEKPQRVKLKKGSWEEGLLGVAKGCKRMIMLSPFLVVRSEFQEMQITVLSGTTNC